MSFIELNDDQRRQLINAKSVFTALEQTRQDAAEIKGGMYWKRQGAAEYLIRTSTTNSQKSLGLRSPETEAIYYKFTEKKHTLETRLKTLKTSLDTHRRLNRALNVGRAPQILIEILNAMESAGIAQYFTVIGTHALYAYEAEMGVFFEQAGAMETKDVDLLWDTRRQLKFISQMNILGSSMLGVLQKVDASFALRPEQKYTAVNSQGFEVDILRREAIEGDPHPLKITSHEDDFWVVQAKKADVFLQQKKFTTMIVSNAGHMARIHTIPPQVFVDFKRWMSSQPDREPIKRNRDLTQANMVQALIDAYYPDPVA